MQAPTLTTDSPPAYNDAEAETQPGSHPRKRQRRGGGRDSKGNPESGGSSSNVVDHLLDRLDRMEARLAHMETELWQAKALAGEHTESLQELRDAHGKATDELDDLSAHIDDYVVVKMDDHMDFVKIELQDFVEDRLADVEDRVMDRVMSATISLSINE
jgi:chromosome segregation ATPase